MPNRFMAALTPKRAIIVPRSQIPTSMPMSTIISDELKAYS